MGKMQFEFCLKRQYNILWKTLMVFFKDSAQMPQLQSQYKEDFTFKH